MNEIEVEMFRSKDEPSQLWKRAIKEGTECKNDWQVDIIYKDYEHLMDENRAAEIPEYAVQGRMIVANDGTVKQAYIKNPNFDKAKIALCKLRKT